MSTARLPGALNASRRLGVMGCVRRTPQTKAVMDTIMSFPGWSSNINHRFRFRHRFNVNYIVTERFPCSNSNIQVVFFIVNQPDPLKDDTLIGLVVFHQTGNVLHINTSINQQLAA